MSNKLINLDFFKSKFVTQIFWVVAGLGAAQGLRLAGNLVLTRMLNPGDFGLLAIATSILVGVNMFSDVGLGGAVIRSNKTDRPGYMETIWTLSAIRGVVIGILLLLVAYPVSIFYGHPELVYIIASYTAISVAMGCASANLWLYDKKLDLRKRIINEFLSQLFSIVVMIVWAWISPSYWALVGGAVSSALFFSIFSHFIYKGNRPKIHWDKEAIYEVFHYGKWVFPATAVTYVASQGDRLIMGAVLAIEEVGVYTIAATFASLVTMIIGKITMRVLQPLFKQYHDRNNIHGIRNVRLAIICASACICILTAIWGDKIIECLYDDRYVDGGWMLQLLSIRGIAVGLAATMAAYVLAVGQPKANFHYEATNACILVAGMLMGAKYGLAAMILAYTAGPFICLPVLVRSVRKEGLQTAHTDIPILLSSIGIIVLGWVLSDSVVLVEIYKIF